MRLVVGLALRPAAAALAAPAPAATRGEVEHRMNDATAAQRRR